MSGDQFRRGIALVTLLPLYWLAIFLFILDWFEPGLYTAVVGGSYALSLFNYDWGVIGMRRACKVDEGAKRTAIWHGQTTIT